MRDATKIIRSTLTRNTPGEPLHHGPVFAAPFHSPGDPSQNPYTYARSHNPTWTALEKAIAQLESGADYRASAIVFSSGMAACAAVFGAVLRPGDIAVLPSNAYYAARVLMQEYFTKMGIQLRTAPTADNAQASQLEGARLPGSSLPATPRWRSPTSPLSAKPPTAPVRSSPSTAPRPHRSASAPSPSVPTSPSSPTPNP